MPKTKKTVFSRTIAPLDNSKQLRKFKKWISSYEAASSWLQKYDLEQLLIDNNGLVKIENFLPEFVADGILSTLEAIPDAAWNMTAAGDDYTHNNIKHEFLSVKQLPQLQEVFRLFTLLLPDSLFTFSAAKYCRQGHIVPHDDRAYTNVLMEDGSVQLCSRSIAVIYYLTRDWQPSFGGALLDHEAPGGAQVHVPTFNSAIVFTIPRWHEVTPVTTDRPRYSIFGWFLEPGKLYELNTEPMPAAAAAAAHGQQQQQQAGQVEDKQEDNGKQLLHAKKVKKRKCKKTRHQEQQQQLGGASGSARQAQQQQQQQQQQSPPVSLEKKRNKRRTGKAGAAAPSLPQQACLAADGGVLKKKRKKTTSLHMAK